MSHLCVCPHICKVEILLYKVVSILCLSVRTNRWLCCIHFFPFITKYVLVLKRTNRWVLLNFCKKKTSVGWQKHYQTRIESADSVHWKASIHVISVWCILLRETLTASGRFLIVSGGVSWSSPLWVLERRVRRHGLDKYEAWLFDVILLKYFLKVIGGICALLAVFILALPVPIIVNR